MLSRGTLLNPLLARRAAPPTWTICSAYVHTGYRGQRETAKVSQKDKTLWRRAVQAEKDRRREEAKELYERNVAAQPEHGASWLRWGLLEKERGAFDKARKLFKLGAICATGPEYVYHAWARMELELGDTALAEQLVADGLAVASKGKSKSRNNIGSLHEVRAMIAESQDDAPDARLHFKAAVQADPRNGHLWMKWAQLEIREKNVDLSKKLLQRAVDIDQNDDWRAVHAMAVHARGVGDPDLARTLFQRCIEIVDRNPRAGGVKSRSGEKEGRENALGSVFHALAMLEKEAGDTDAARAAFTSATEAAPRYSYAWQSWGLLEKEVGDVDKARKYLSMSAAYTAPGQAAVPCWHALGRLEEEEGDTKAARTCYQRGLEVAPRSSVLWSCLGSLEAASGNSESARHCFSTAVKVDPKGSVTLGVVKLWAETEQEMDSASGAEAGRSAIKRLVSLGGGAERGVSPAAGSVAPIVVPTHASASQFAAAAAAMASRASVGPGSKDNRWLVTAWAEYEAACGNKDEAKALRERAAQA